MRRRGAVALATLAAPAMVGALALGACNGAPTGIGEPIYVYGAQFIPGPLPGGPPVDGGTVGDSGVDPQVTAVSTPAIGIRPGEAGRSMTGDVTPDATAIAVRWQDAGTGYWVFPPGPVDDSALPDLGWSMTFDTGYDLPTGQQNLAFAALDATGDAGTQFFLQMCVGSILPDNYNACYPALPPVAVLSLSWDEPVDLDLQLQTPSGAVVDIEHPTTNASPDAGIGPGVGVLDMDSDANCTPDHVNREDIVWNTGTPEAGTYLVYANLFSACGQSSVRFTASLWVAEPVGDGGTSLVEVLSVPGELLAIDANGGSGLGLYLTSFTFPFSDGGT
jgi:hypothetical protein